MHSFPYARGAHRASRPRASQADTPEGIPGHDDQRHGFPHPRPGRPVHQAQPAPGLGGASSPATRPRLPARASSSAASWPPPRRPTTRHCSPANSPLMPSSTPPRTARPSRSSSATGQPPHASPSSMLERPPCPPRHALAPWTYLAGDWRSSKPSPPNGATRETGTAAWSGSISTAREPSSRSLRATAARPLEHRPGRPVTAAATPPARPVPGTTHR